MLIADRDAMLLTPNNAMSPPLVIADLMSRPLVTASPELEVDEARLLMRREQVHHLVVVEDGRLLGLVDDRALADYRAWGQVLERVRLAEVVRPPRCVFTPRTPLRSAASEMLRQGCTAAAVLDGDRIVGLFTATDALRYMAEATSPPPPTHRSAVEADPGASERRSGGSSASAAVASRRSQI